MEVPEEIEIPEEEPPPTPPCSPLINLFFKVFIGVALAGVFIYASRLLNSAIPVLLYIVLLGVYSWWDGSKNDTKNTKETDETKSKYVVGSSLSPRGQLILNVLLGWGWHCRLFTLVTCQTVPSLSSSLLFFWHFTVAWFLQNMIRRKHKKLMGLNYSQHQLLPFCHRVRSF